jgi:hypothetical protein
MHRLTSLLVLLVLGALLAGTCGAAPPPDKAVQGLYVGFAGFYMAGQKLDARVVATGHGTYKVLLRSIQQTGSTAKNELDGKTDGDYVLFLGKVDGAQWTLSWTSGDGLGAIRGTYGPYGTVELKRVTSSSYSGPPPAGAIVLLNGNHFDELTKPRLRSGAEQPWKPVEVPTDRMGMSSGMSSNWEPVKCVALEVPTGGMSSKRSFAGSFRLHVEFFLPLMPEARGQQRARSGVQLPNGDVIQVLDSFGMITDKGCGCGGLYAYKDPDSYFDEFSLASVPPLQWQSFDVEYHVDTKDGKPTGQPRVTVLHNGCKIHDNVKLPSQARVGALHFQDHGSPVVYRNIWVQPLAPS